MMNAQFVGGHTKTLTGFQTRWAAATSGRDRRRSSSSRGNEEERQCHCGVCHATAMQYNHLIGDLLMTNQELLNRISINPNMAFGKPTIRGLRYSVEWLLETLSSGMTNEEILADYEDLELADIHAALLYAARLSQVKRMSMVVA
jgi:uncharacterized protein (DUF433 family)